MENQQYEIFNLIKTKNNKVIITIGKYKVSATEYDNYEDAIYYLNSMPWEIIANLCAIYYEERENLQKEEIKDNQEDENNEK